MSRRKAGDNRKSIPRAIGGCIGIKRVERVERGNKCHIYDTHITTVAKDLAFVQHSRKTKHSHLPDQFYVFLSEVPNENYNICTQMVIYMIQSNLTRLHS